MICIRLDATVIPACSEKEGAEPNYKGFGHHPLLAYCDNTAEPLAGMLRPGSAGSNTTADHLQVLDEAITAVPARRRRRLMVTCDGAGADLTGANLKGARGIPAASPRTRRTSPPRPSPP